MKKVIYGFYTSPFGEIVIAKTDKGLCWLGFMVEGYKGNGLNRMKAHLKGATFEKDNNEVQSLGRQIIEAWEKDDLESLQYDLHGTDFQKSVWNALLKIRKGVIVSYGDIANDLRKTNASRAVGSAVGENPVSLVIPCHRVVQKSGALGNYGWGVDLKRKMLEAEGLLFDHV
ncbi:MAG: methylated-DNA--[protein]-cysteine S-methyltransferase [Alphaproteobacteria bacterium]|nr:methylated-DNA--[protein]-cysteine S-methyltransferase [Alphaproteobacteria bacterium]